MPRKLALALERDRVERTRSLTDGFAANQQRIAFLLNPGRQNQEAESRRFSLVDKAYVSMEFAEPWYVRYDRAVLFAQEFG